MNRRAWIRRAALAAVLATVVVLLVIAGSGRRDPWAGPGVCASEAAFMRDALKRLIEEWQETRDRLRPAMLGMPAAGREGTGVLLVIDTAQGAAWIEEGGRPWPGRRVELGKRWRWTVLLQSPTGIEETAGPVRCMVRAWGTGDQRPEQVLLVGRTPAGDRHLAVNFSAYDLGTTEATGAVNPPGPPALRQRVGDAEAPSIVLTPEEAAEAVRSAAGVAAPPDRLADWRQVEPEVYRQVERRVNAEGYELQGVRVAVGETGQAAHAGMGAYRNSPPIFDALFHRHRSMSALILFDHLGEGVWHAAVLGGGPRARDGSLEFLVTAPGRALDDPEQWMARWRDAAKRPSRPPEPGPWLVHLPNGATAELIGICEAPSLGRAWWRPDGTPLEPAPYVTVRSWLPERPDRNCFELALHVNTGGGSSGVTTRIEGNRGNSGGSLQDRYGIARSDLDRQTVAFDRSQDRTTIRIGVTVGEGARQWLEFRDVSLVRGKDFGCKVVVGDEAGPKDED